MKKAFIVLIAVLIVFTAFPVSVMAVQASPSRVINVVYDDSGSMYDTDDKPVDTWCQAKYSMEVFAAMLGEADTMNVYYMSDYQSGTSAKPRMVLAGADGAEANVAKVHSQKTKAGSTPFNSLKKAHKDLESAKADEKWLVVLTDGKFEDGKVSKKEVDDYLAKKSPDVKVVFLGIGSNAAGITDAPDKDIMYVEAKNNSQILNKITDICTRIFNSNKLEVDVSSKTTLFDIPMGELTVFAQGANVSINGIKNADGKLIKSSKEPVEVKYSSCDATNYNNTPTKDLTGSIATFKDDFAAGSYTIDVSGSETIEIYYKPNIEVAAYLTDEEGNDVADIANLEAGEYTISFGFVKKGTQEKVNESKLLGNVEYEAYITNNGKTYEKSYSSGEKVTLEEGTLDISVTATYLDYNSVSTDLNYSIYKDKNVSFSVGADPTYTIVSEGIQNKEYIEVNASVDGHDFSVAQWEEFELPSVKLKDAKRDFKINDPTIEKTDTPGVLRIYPELPGGKPSVGTYTDCDYEISYQQTFGSETWSGGMTGTIKMNDTRPWFERNWDLFVKLAVFLSILFVLIGYLPFVKNYLPKSLKKKPYIKCVPSTPGTKRKDRNGIVNKSLLSTILPYVSQKGTIKYVPKGVTGVPVLAVKAKKHRRMALTNYKAFIGKDITFDGESIKKDLKKFETGAGVCIVVKRGGWTYTCTPNQAN